MQLSESKPRIVNPARTQALFEGTLTGSGSTTIDFVVHADTLLLSLFVRSINNGSLVVKVSTFHRPGEEIEVIEFPAITAPTAELVLKKAAVVIANCKLTIEYTGDCDIQVVGKGLSVGDLSVAVVGAAEMRTQRIVVGTANQLLFAAALTDRAGVVLKNYNTTGTLFFAESSAQLDGNHGFPLAPGEPFSMDLAAGQEIWVKGTVAGMDVRTVEAAT